MSIAGRNHTFPAPATDEIYRMPVDHYERLVARGGFDEDDPIELLNGVLVRKMPKGTHHSKSLTRCRRHLERLVPGDAFHLRTETPVRIPDFSEPEPDLSIVRGDEDRYTDRNPGPADVVLIVEVSETSLPRDRGEKKDLYAQAGIPTYWVVNLPERRLEVFMDPADGAYTSTLIVGEDGDVELVVDGTAWGRIEVAPLLP